MSTVPGSAVALFFEESIVSHILSSENLQYMWAACRYLILINISKVAHSRGSVRERRTFDPGTNKAVQIISREKACSSGNILTTKRIVKDRFKVIWNPDLRLRQGTRHEQLSLDIYGDLLDSDSLVIPSASALQLLEANLIDQVQFTKSMSLACEIRDARSQLYSQIDNNYTSYKKRIMDEISSFCADIEVCLQEALGNNDESAQICLAHIQASLIAVIQIPMLAKGKFIVNIGIRTGLLMHCGNYVLDPVLVLMWKLTGNQVCDFTHAYAGVGHIAYTQRPEFVSLSTYTKLMPNITIGGLHMWKPIVPGEIAVDVESIAKWVGHQTRQRTQVRRINFQLLFVSTGQYIMDSCKIKTFLKHILRIVNLGRQKEEGILRFDVRLHPKEISTQALLKQVPIEEVLGDVDIIIGEFSTCLLQANDLGKMIISITNGLHRNVYSSINANLIGGYEEEDASKAAEIIRRYIRNRYSA